jgi:hypothetical protein
VTRIQEARSWIEIIERDGRGEGSFCHIVIADHNIEDDNLRFCLAEAALNEPSPYDGKKESPKVSLACQSLMILMLRMSILERKELLGLKTFTHCPNCGEHGLSEDVNGTWDCEECKAVFKIELVKGK